MATKRNITSSLTTAGPTQDKVRQTKPRRKQQQSVNLTQLVPELVKSFTLLGSACSFIQTHNSSNWLCYGHKTQYHIQFDNSGTDTGRGRADKTMEKTTAKCQNNTQVRI